MYILHFSLYLLPITDIYTGSVASRVPYIIYSAMMSADDANVKKTDYHEYRDRNIAAEARKWAKKGCFKGHNDPWPWVMMTLDEES